jgi:hypothetical protein
MTMTLPGATLATASLICGRRGRKPAKGGVDGLNDYHPNRKRRDVLLIAQPLIDGKQDIEVARSASEKLTVPEAGPTLLLNGAHVCIRDLAAQFARHVLVE